MTAQKVAAAVVCFGATPGFDYRRHLLSLLLCPGRRFLLDAQGRLFSAAGPRGVGLLLRAALSLGGQKVAAPLLQTLTRLRAPRPLAPDGLRRLLLIRQDHIGDVVLSLPTIQALKEHFPGAQIDALVGSASARLLADVRELNEVIVCDSARFARGQRGQNAAERLALMRRLRRARYDLAIDLRGDDTARLWALASGARYRAGPAHGPYETAGRVNLAQTLTHALPSPVPETGTRHAAEAGVELMRPLGVCAPLTPFRLRPLEERTQAVRRKCAELGVSAPYALVHATPGDPVKQWSRASFAAVARYLIQHHGLNVLLTGAPEDREHNGEIMAQAGLATGLVNGAGVFSLEEMPALCADARLMVTVDTGPMHIAAAVGTPLVALFLPWATAVFYPHGQPDSVLVPSEEGLKELERTGRLWTGPLLDAISVREVCAAIDRKMEAAHV